MSNTWRPGIGPSCLALVVLLNSDSSASALVVPHQVPWHGASPTFHSQCSRQRHLHPWHQTCFQREASTKNRQHSPIILHDNGSSDNGIVDRFVNPKIDDPWLPLNEAGVAQIVAPSFEIFWTILNNAPYPSWATTNAVFATRGAFLAPTLIHGAALACCWLAGCLAAKAYEKEAYEGDLGTVIFSTIKAGAFASGLLILSTQLVRSDCHVNKPLYTFQFRNSRHFGLSCVYE